MLFSILPQQHLYLDPGSGSIIFQVLIAGLLAAGVFVRTQWGRIKGLFEHKPQQNEHNQTDDHQPES